jgi:hypothetical protein
MKKKALARNLALLIALSAGGLFAQSPDSSSVAPFPDSLLVKDPKLTMEAMAYLQAMVAPLEEVRQSNYHYLQSVTRVRKARAVEKKRQELLKALQSVKDIVQGSKPLHGDATLKTDLIQYLDLVTIVLKNDFGKILDMEDIAAQSYDQTEAHQMALDMATAKLNASFGVLRNAQLAFFKKYGIRAIDKKDGLDLKIERVNKAISYYDTIFRIFFKVNHQNSYAQSAMTAKDAAGLEQHATTLVSFAEDALELIKQKHGYEGDNELIATAVKLLEYYRYAGQKAYPANIEFEIKTDNFRAAEKKMNAIKATDRTAEVINQYNGEVNAYNAAVKEINRINKQSFKTHRQLIKLWNTEMKKFFKNHS